MSEVNGHLCAHCGKWSLIDHVKPELRLDTTRMPDFYREELLFPEKPIDISREIAKLTGIKIAIFISAILELQNGPGGWVRKTHVDWLKILPFWDIGVIKRLLKKMETAGLITRYKYTSMTCDRTKSYQVNIDMIHELVSAGKPLSEGGYVYLLKRDDGCHKIGISIAPEKRLIQIRRQHPSACIVHTFYSKEYVEAEKELHTMFEVGRKDGEWFDLDEIGLQLICRVIRYENNHFYSSNGAMP